MLITEDFGKGKYQIKSYTQNEIIINETPYTHSLIISSQTLIPHWRPTRAEEINENDLQEIVDLKPDILLLGTGQHFVMPADFLLNALNKHHIGVECMHTRAACQTFMVLASEDRRVAAALILAPTV